MNIIIFCLFKSFVYLKIKSFKKLKSLKNDLDYHRDITQEPYRKFS